MRTRPWGQAAQERRTDAARRAAETLNSALDLGGSAKETLLVGNWLGTPDGQTQTNDAYDSSDFGKDPAFG
jgi:hypothetical protein